MPVELDQGSGQAFPDCGEKPLGLYPVVDRAAWLERLCPLGISTIQLRIKDLEGEALTQEIRQAVAIAQQYDVRLFINDYWEEAIACGAYGVHLGQDAIGVADFEAIKAAGLRLGMSTHGAVEIAKVYAIRPSYIAFGIIFPTTSKVMPTEPWGVKALAFGAGILIVLWSLLVVLIMRILIVWLLLAPVVWL